MSERATQLATMATTYRQFEAMTGFGEAGRRASRDMLRRDAVKLGFAPAEIDAAVDAAIASVSGEK